MPEQIANLTPLRIPRDDIQDSGILRALDEIEKYLGDLLVSLGRVTETGAGNINTAAHGPITNGQDEDTASVAVTVQQNATQVFIFWQMSRITDVDHEAKLKRDTTTLDDNPVAAVGHHFVDTPGSGKFTYKLNLKRITVGSTSWTADDRVVVIELLK